MIPRISKGSSAYGALSYDHGKGRRDEHENPHKVAGNVPGRTWRERAKAIDNHARTARADVVKPLHRTSLRVSETDRKLTDREWKQVANEYIERMGFDKCPWEATRHADDHIHITVNRVQWDGKLANTSHDYAKAQAASRKIEKTHGLEDASRKFKRERPEVSKGEKESAARRQVKPEREQLRDKLDTAERTSDGTRASYEEKLTEQGVKHRANVSKTTGRVSGYSYGLDGHKDASNEQVWMKGSQLGKDYSWNQTEKRLSEQQRTRTAQPAPERTTPPADRTDRRPTTQHEAGQQKPAQPRTAEKPAAKAPLTREQARDRAQQEVAQRRQQRDAPEQHRGPQETNHTDAKTDTRQTEKPPAGGTPQGMSQDAEKKPLSRDQARDKAQQEVAQRRQQREAPERNKEQGRER
ncbi:relaxase/mobilization nuclease domain-containing protein [Rhodococcus qingshengii]